MVTPIQQQEQSQNQTAQPQAQCLIAIPIPRQESTRSHLKSPIITGHQEQQPINILRSTLPPLQDYSPALGCLIIHPAPPRPPPDKSSLASASNTTLTTNQPATSA